MSRVLAARKAAYRLKWLTDWRTGATVAATVLVALLAFVVVDSANGRREALDALEAQAAQGIDVREAQSRRIDVLQEQVADLTDQILALRDQLAAMGVEPAVSTPARPKAAERDVDREQRRTTTPRRTTTTSRPPRSTTTTARPTTTSEPSCTTLPALEECL